MRLYQWFADMIDYPGPDLSQRIDECITLTSPLHEEATGLLKKFRAFLGKIPLDTAGELYTRTFGPEAACSPCVGYQLFGNGHHREMFQAGLKEHYQVYGFSTGNDLPDHLCVMLRFLAGNEDKEERDELVSLCILPALKKMLKGFGDDRNPYKDALQALLLLLQEDEEGVGRQGIRMAGREELGHDR
jgi:nitrate reductase delta subunit